VATERLQKWLAGLGVGSRREIESWIVAGRIAVNGATATLGQKVSGLERIVIDGRPVRGRPVRIDRAETLVYHKPVGEVCTRRDPQGRATVFDSLPKPKQGRWIMVGRLDLDTSGVLLFTTDGNLANALMHPSNEVAREYAVRILGAPTEADIDRLCHGLQLEDGYARFNEVQFTGGEGANRWYRVTVAEGRNRLVRRLWEAAGFQVSRLIRVRFGSVELPRRLARGRFAMLADKQLEKLYADVGLERAAGHPRS
jgi:23S rRNA pseudouridine2605 synthase